MARRSNTCSDEQPKGDAHAIERHVRELARATWHEALEGLVRRGHDRAWNGLTPPGAAIFRRAAEKDSEQGIFEEVSRLAHEEGHEGRVCDAKRLEGRA